MSNVSNSYAIKYRSESSSDDDLSSLSIEIIEFGSINQLVQVLLF